MFWQRVPLSLDPRLEGVEPLVTIEFVSPEDMQSINAETRGIDEITDVLSFPMLHVYEGALESPLSPGDVHPGEDGEDVLELGDLVICPKRVLEQAETFGHSERREVVFLTVHGMPYLCGYDHMEADEREKMEIWQRKIMAELGVGRGEYDALLAENLVTDEGTLRGVAEKKDVLAESEFRSGFIALVGRPNAGKSTLLNYLSDLKLAIVSRKAQTTRHTIRSVVNTTNAQMIFLDTPGMHKPDHQLGRNMMKNVWLSFQDADIVLLLVDGKGIQ